jgi:hypothetical protein
MRRKNLAIVVWLIGFLSLFATGCVHYGDLRMNPVGAYETVLIAGSLSLGNPVEADLLASVRGVSADIITFVDYSKFRVTASSSAVQAAKDGTFRMEKVPYADDLLVRATAGKVVLLKRLYPRDLRLTDTSKVTIDLDTTARALVWQKAREQKVELTEADIGAREYLEHIASISFALKMALLLPKKNVPQTILELDMIQEPVRKAAAIITPREKSLVEAYSVVQNILQREDSKLLSYYISADFSNDYDSNSNYQDLVSTVNGYFKNYDIKTASYTITQMEFLANNQARVRTFSEIYFTNRFSAVDGRTLTYAADVLWRKEAGFWKILRNLPYASHHPTQLGADAAWGEIARAHQELASALFREDIQPFITHVAPAFGNDWDPYSTTTDLLETARQRFLTFDVKTATYTVRGIEFFGTDLAKVQCSAQVRFINVKTGLDVDTGAMHAVVEWRRIDGVWRLARNLPYRFAHPRNLLKAVIKEAFSRF